MKYLFPFSMFFFLSLSSMTQSNDQQTVSNAVEKLRKAMIDADKTALEDATADSLSYGHSSGKVESKIEFVENIVSGRSDFVTIDLSEQTISITNNVAVVRHLFIATTNDGGVPGTVKLKVLLVFEKEKEGWKLLARQAVKLV